MQPRLGGKLLIEEGTLIGQYQLAHKVAGGQQPRRSTSQPPPLPNYKPPPPYRPRMSSRRSIERSFNVCLSEDESPV